MYFKQVLINLNDSQNLEVTLQGSTNESSESKPSGANGYAMVMPVKVRVPGGEFWTLPVEPLVSLSGGNKIARRMVAKSKGRGTIKERWSQDDYSITIDGIFIKADNCNEYPEEEVARLREICESASVIEIECDLLKYFDITRMVIESYSFPFTKGEQNQRYMISGYSDDLFELLESQEDIKPLEQ